MSSVITNNPVSLNWVIKNLPVPVLIDISKYLHVDTRAFFMDAIIHDLSLRKDNHGEMSMLLKSLFAIASKRDTETCTKVDAHKRIKMSSITDKDVSMKICDLLSCTTTQHIRIVQRFIRHQQLVRAYIFCRYFQPLDIRLSHLAFYTLRCMNTHITFASD